MKRIFVIIILILFLGSSILLYTHLQIQNIFDELYYGHQDISLLRMTNASYNHFGLLDIPNSMRNLVENEIIEYLETDLLNDGDFLSFEWILNEKKLKFMYISTSKADGFHFVFDIIYSQRTKTLTYLPIRILTNDNLPYDKDLFLKVQGITQASIEEFLKHNFFDNIVTRWIEVNEGKSRFSLHDIGTINVEINLWD